MHGNSYSTLAIAPSTGLGGPRRRSELPEGARSDGYPLGVRYDAATRRAVAEQACGHSPFIPGDGGNGERMQPGILVAVVVAGIVLVVVVAVLAYGLYQRRRKAAAEDEYTEFSSTA